MIRIGGDTVREIVRECVFLRDRECFIERKRKSKREIKRKREVRKARARGRERQWKGKRE